MVDKKRWKKLIDVLHKNKNINKSQKDNLYKMIESPDHTNVSLAQEISYNFIKEELLEGLNPQQSEGYRKIISFITYSDHDAFVLKGFAGTGKTYMLSRIIDYIKVIEPKSMIAITAPTNKAVKVAKDSNSFNSNNKEFVEFIDKGNGISYKTIHSLLKLKEIINNEGERKFVPTASLDKDSIKYVIIDEASMVNKELYSIIMQIKEHAKIIFVGDPIQLPPVNEENSIVFNKIEENNLDSYELNIPMRQSDGSPVLKYATEIRERITSPYPDKDFNNQVGIDSEVRIFDIKEDKAEIKKLLVEYFKSDEYKKDLNYVKILAWTNRTVENMNNTVRKILYGPTPNKYEIGESMIVNKPTFSKKNYGNKSYLNVQMPTSTEFTVMDVTNSSKYVDEIRERFDTTELTVEVNGYNFNSIKQIHILKEHEETRFKAICKQLHKAAVDAKSAELWATYYDVKDKYFANVEYNYSSTIHTAQGSTYQNVFLVMGDINRNRKIDERNRLKYTGISRAKKKVFIIK